jgi:hypothetical protein
MRRLRSMTEKAAAKSVNEELTHIFEGDLTLVKAFNACAMHSLVRSRSPDRDSGASLSSNSSGAELPATQFDRVVGRDSSFLITKKKLGSGRKTDVYKVIFMMVRLTL